ncbi:MAG: LysM peptidoglycan-binding domain-containing protein [Erysipelotrichaceae bacterium]|nr:LysM peptidoglycan-binding domain-containing protein [Erysipelotrichaceae bacterium]
MGESTNKIIELATINWRQSRIIKKLDDSSSEVKRLTREIDRLSRVLTSYDVEINDYEGRKNNNLNVETASIEESSMVKDEIIFETISPEIKYKGIILKKSRVVVHKPIEDMSSDTNKPLFIKNDNDLQILEKSSKDNQQSNQNINDIQETKSSSKKVEENKVNSRNIIFITWLVIISIISVAGIILSLKNGSKNLDYIHYEMENIISENNRIINEYKERIIELKEINSQLREKTDQNINDIQIDNNSSNSDENIKDNVIKFRKYIVQDGDSLYNICKSNNIDYEEYLQIVVNINGIKNPNKIFNGQVLLLPVQ